MLTPKDLSAIEKIVETKINKTVRPIVQEELSPIKKDLNQLKKDMVTVKKDLKKVKKVVEDTSDFLDREILKDRKRIEILEHESNLRKDFI